MKLMDGRENGVIDLADPGLPSLNLLLTRLERMTEKELIRGVIAKDREAVTCLVERYQKKIIKTAYYFLGNMEDAEDLAQDIFLEIVNSMGKFRQSSALSTWIYRITVNRSLNALKRNKRRQIFLRIESAFGIMDKDQNSMEGIVAEDQALAEEEKRKLVKIAVDSLPSGQRTAFILHKYEELPYKEIAEVMGTSLSSVESLMHRAKMNLQKSLVRHFKEYSKK